MLDFTTPHGQRAAERLRTEAIIWLTTVGGDGTPQPSPVWFLWEEDTVLIFSKPKAPKIANIRREPRVALHFNSDADGGDIVILTGQAEVVPEDAAAVVPNAYLTKYADGIKDIGLTPETMTAEYSAVIRITPTKLRGF
jgi:PPOX class probable F420-dependent enzyme